MRGRSSGTRRRVGYYRGCMERLREERGNRCEVVHEDTGRRCLAGPESNLEFAHVKPTGCTGMGRGMSNRYHDIKRNPDCYKLMCKPCHKRYDAKHWERLRETFEDEGEGEVA